VHFAQQKWLAIYPASLLQTLADMMALFDRLPGQIPLRRTREWGVVD